MKHLLAALIISVLGLTGYEAYSNPEKFQASFLQAKIKVMNLVGVDPADLNEELFFMERDDLMKRYDMVKDEFSDKKSAVEAEFADKKGEVADATELDSEIDTLQDRVEGYQAEFEAKKIEIETKIEDLKRRYEETKTAVNGIQDSVQKIQDGTREGRESLQKLKSAVSN